MKCKSLPRAMRSAPLLPEHWRPRSIDPHLVVLLNPFYPKDPHASYGKHVLTPSLALTSLAGATPPPYRVEYHDENLLQRMPLWDPFPAVVGITVHLTFAKRAYQLARWFRERGSRVIFGGLHVLSCPDEVAPHADAIVLGDGVAVWPQVLADCAAGELAPRYEGSYRDAYRKAPAPDRRILQRQSFLTTSSLIATRGCHNRCGFCYLATEGLHMPYQMLDPQQIVEQWLADDQPYAVFIDNNLGSRPEYLRALCRALRPLDKIWSAAVTLDITDDPLAVREMALAGCTGVFIGFESLTDQNLVDARKKTPRASDYLERVRLLHDHGIQVNGSFVLGFDHDDASVFERTATWIEEARLECATFHILTPYPGTPLYQTMEAEGRLLHRDWDLYDTAHVVFRPRRMSVEELADGYAWCYERLFSHASIWKRRPTDMRAVPAYMAMSYLYKRANPLWHLLIRHRLTARVWRPLVEWTRRRHLKFRRRLAAGSSKKRSSAVISAGV
jgi:radical SAM superfamily enzyme YgiQ (UPF0313 family)